MYVLRRRKYDRALIAQVDKHSRLDLHFMHEFRIHPGAGDGQRLKQLRGFGRTIHQHSAGSIGRFTPRLAALHHQNFRSAFAQLKRQRESDNACPDDDYVPTLHACIVKDCNGLARQLTLTALVLNNCAAVNSEVTDSSGGTMPEEGEATQVEQYEQQSSTGKWILVFLVIIFVAAAVYGYVSTQLKVAKLTNDLTGSQAQITELQKRIQSAEAEEETLGKALGITKRELAQRAAELQAQQAQQRSAESRLEAEENAQKEQIGQVSGEVAGVKTDVGGVKTDVASTRADLEATKAKLQTAVGDLGVQSGLIATTQKDLEVLKHKGDRNYYEFTLLKGAKPQPVATVSLQLKNADAKRAKFSMNVTSDDRTIEKKDRNVAEPIQFYSGRDHLLFELVVWTVDKKKVTGYLSTPKNAPVPVTAN